LTIAVLILRSSYCVRDLPRLVLKNEGSNGGSSFAILAVLHAGGRESFQFRKWALTNDADAADKTGYERVVKKKDWAPTLSAVGSISSGCRARVFDGARRDRQRVGFKAAARAKKGEYC